MTDDPWLATLSLIGAVLLAVAILALVAVGIAWLFGMLNGETGE